MNHSTRVRDTDQWLGMLNDADFTDRCIHDTSLPNKEELKIDLVVMYTGSQSLQEFERYKIVASMICFQVSIWPFNHLNQDQMVSTTYV